MQNISIKKILIISIVVFLGLASYATATLVFPQVPLRMGTIKVVQPNGQEWSITATTSTALGNGNALYYAYSLAPCGSTLTLSSTTNPYRINSYIDLGKGNTCNPALSIRGEPGQYPEIDGNDVSSFYTVMAGNLSTIQGLTIRGVQDYAGASAYSFVIGLAFVNNITATIRDIRSYGTTDCLYMANGNTGYNITIDHFIGQSHWDCGLFDFPNGTSTITDSEFSVVSPPAVGGTLRATNFARGKYTVYNSFFHGETTAGSNITALQIDPSTSAKDSVYMLSGKLEALGPSPAYEIQNIGSGKIYIGASVIRNTASTTGAVLYPDQGSIAQSLGSGPVTFTASSTFTATTTFTSGVHLCEDVIATSSTSIVDWGKCQQHLIQLGAGAMTLSFTDISGVGDKAVIYLANPAGPPGTVTWPTTAGAAVVTWSGGLPPSQSSSTSTVDMYQCTATQGTSTTAGLVSKIFCLQGPSAFP